jgi:hypothetical protein
MRQLRILCSIGAGMAALLTISTGCTLKATIKETTDTTMNVTGTTSGRIWWNEDGLLSPEHKALAFATYNEANLEQDIAKGHGEYLTSLGSLLGMTADSQPFFQEEAQKGFGTLLASDHAARLEQLRALPR